MQNPAALGASQEQVADLQGDVTELEGIVAEQTLDIAKQTKSILELERKIVVQDANTYKKIGTMEGDLNSKMFNMQIKLDSSVDQIMTLLNQTVQALHNQKALIDEEQRQSTDHAWLINSLQNRLTDQANYIAVLEANLTELANANETEHYTPHIEDGVVQCIDVNKTSKDWLYSVPGKFQSRDVLVPFAQPYAELPKVHVSTNRLWNNIQQEQQLGIDGSSDTGTDNVNFNVQVTQVTKLAFVLRCEVQGIDRLMLKALSVNWMSIL